MACAGVVRVGVEPPYEVQIGGGLLGGLGDMVRGVAPGGKAFVVTDSGVPDSVIQTAAGSLGEAGFKTTTFEFSPTESAKSIAWVEKSLSAMAESLHERGDPVVVIGGGIAGDLGGFASAIYRRGTPVIQCPTTLLAMVDASVGGKTGVNLASSGGLLKNFVGAFHQPKLVVADVETLASLEPRVFRCGLAECVKHAMIAGGVGDAGLGAWIDAHLNDILDRGEALSELVERNVRIKASIVADDAREEKVDGGRARLNLGHTFGHAMETIPELAPEGEPAPLMHGEAVGLGLVCAATVSCELGLLEASRRDALLATLERIGLPTRVRGLPSADDLITRMGHDKKVRGGRLRLVLPTGGASATIRDDVPGSAIRSAFDAIRA